MTELAYGAAQTALAAVALFSILLVSLHVLKPEFDPSWRMISEYEIGRHGWIMRVAFVCWSGSVVGVAVALWPYASVAGTAALVIMALGPLGAAVFATDPITTPPESTTVAHRWHLIFGAVFILGFPVAATIVDWNVAASGLVAAPQAVWLSVIPWIGLIAFIGSTIVFGRRSGRRVGPDVPIGWPNRFMVATYVAWIVVISGTVIRR